MQKFENQLVPILSHEVGKSSRRFEDEELQAHKMAVLLRAMETYESRYDGADLVQSALNYVRRSSQAIPCEMLTWPGRVDVLAWFPKHYLRLAHTIDTALRENDLPDNNDLSADLQGLFNNRGTSVWQQTSFEEANQDEEGGDYGALHKRGPVSDIFDVVANYSPEVNSESCCNITLQRNQDDHEPVSLHNDAQANRTCMQLPDTDSMGSVADRGGFLDDWSTESLMEDLTASENVEVRVQALGRITDEQLDNWIISSLEMEGV